MKIFHARGICLLVGLASAASYAFAESAHDEQMRQLASRSGCLTCHGVEAAKPGPNGMAPIGPAWSDVAKKYQGRPDAVEQLTRTVMQGSSPYNSHWAGKVSGLAMPPNAVAIKEQDAKRLVTWILSLAG